MSITDKQAAEARATIRAFRKERKAMKLASFPKRDFPAKPKHGRTLNAPFISWLHEGTDCIACLVMGRAPQGHRRIEAAHQKLNVAAAGWSKKYGVRPDDERSLPLCSWHHRQGPVRCDPAQAKFWAFIGLEPEQVVDFCAELHLAFQYDKPALPIIHHYATVARAAFTGRKEPA